MVYLRRMDRQRAMDDVRDLSWGGPFVFSPRSEKTPVLQAKDPEADGLELCALVLAQAVDLLEKSRSDDKRCNW